MSKPEKLTLVLEPQTHDELRQWAREEGRPIANLLRRIVNQSLDRRRQDLAAHEVAA
jgi:hypothetical protein